MIDLATKNWIRIPCNLAHTKNTKRFVTMFVSDPTWAQAKAEVERIVKKGEKHWTLLDAKLDRTTDGCVIREMDLISKNDGLVHKLVVSPTGEYLHKW